MKKSIIFLRVGIVGIAGIAGITGITKGSALRDARRCKPRHIRINPQYWISYWVVNKLKPRIVIGRFIKYGLILNWEYWWNELGYRRGC